VREPQPRPDAPGPQLRGEREVRQLGLGADDEAATQIEGDRIVRIGGERLVRLVLQPAATAALAQHVLPQPQRVDVVRRRRQHRLQRVERGARPPLFDQLPR
jgi:hypothetical protein